MYAKDLSNSTDEEIQSLYIKKTTQKHRSKTKSIVYSAYAHKLFSGFVNLPELFWKLL